MLLEWKMEYGEGGLLEVVVVWVGRLTRRASQRQATRELDSSRQASNNASGQSWDGGKQQLRHTRLTKVAWRTNHGAMPELIRLRSG